VNGGLMPRQVGQALKTILCVDDNEAGLRTRKMLLEAAGLQDVSYNGGVGPLGNRKPK
jgi:hypothetical protein